MERIPIVSYKIKRGTATNTECSPMLLEISEVKIIQICISTWYVDQPQESASSFFFYAL